MSNERLGVPDYLRLVREALATTGSTGCEKSPPSARNKPDEEKLFSLNTLFSQPIGVRPSGYIKFKNISDINDSDIIDEVAGKVGRDGSASACAMAAARAPNLWLDGTPLLVVWDEPMPGVGRPWFECPVCKRQARHLYLRDPIACRRCCRLDYASRHLHRSIPGYARLHYLRRKLGLEPQPFAPLPERSRSHTRFHRIADEIRALEAGLVGHLSEITCVLERRVRKLK
jgi:hypothetical protein